MRILVIEDEKEIADGVSKILNRAGYQTDCVYDGAEGSDYIFSGIYDLVLLDIMLPTMSGLEVLKTIRSAGVQIPVIMLTAKSQVDDKIDGLNFGADDYITKPFDAGELLARIKARLRNRSGTSNGKLTAFDICLNSMNYRLEKDEKSIKLSRTEYQLLEYLMINKNQILQKDSIICKIWGNEDETDYNNIEVYISFLRKKLRFVDAKAVIVTKKGVGYALIESEEQ